MLLRMTANTTAGLPVRGEGHTFQGLLRVIRVEKVVCARKAVRIVSWWDLEVVTAEMLP